MKAKEYLAKFEKDITEVDDRQATTNLINMFIGEIKDLIVMRHASSEEAMVSILRELNRKWNALSRLDKKRRFKKDGFIKFVKHKAIQVMPSILSAINRNMKEITR
jgi:hypothetical protein